MTLMWVTNIPTPYTTAIWRELAKTVDLHVVCMAGTESNRSWEPDTSGVSLTTVDARSARLGAERTIYLPTRRLSRAVRATKPDVVVLDGWESPAFWQARLAARRSGARVFLSYWSTPESQAFNGGAIARFREKWFRTADGTLTPGHRATAAVRDMGVPDQRISIIHGTVDVTRFAGSMAALRRAQPERNGHHYLYVGQLIPRKNVHALLHAFATVRQAGDILTIVGNGPLRDSLGQLASDLGVDSSVVFAGHLDGIDLHQAYAEAQTLVLPSEVEVWGLVVNEALACGLHVVVSQTCGVSADVAHMAGTYVVAPEEHAIARGLASSARDWNRYIEDPEMAAFTPARTAEAIRRATSEAQLTA